VPKRNVDHRVDDAVAQGIMAALSKHADAMRKKAFSEEVDVGKDGVRFRVSTAESSMHSKAASVAAAAYDAVADMVSRGEHRVD